MPSRSYVPPPPSSQPAPGWSARSAVHDAYAVLRDVRADLRRVSDVAPEGPAGDRATAAEAAVAGALVAVYRLLLAVEAHEDRYGTRPRP
jgi:hypothetical protein